MVSIRTMDMQSCFDGPAVGGSIDTCLDGAATSSSAKRPPWLEVRGIVKDFPGQRALDGVDFVVKAGEIHALLGENGAGKSTLIKIIVGALQHDAGSIRVFGKEVQFSNPHDAVACGIAVVHQHTNLVPTLSVKENLFLGEDLPRLGRFFVNWPAVNKRAKRLLMSLGLEIDPRAMVSELRPDEIAMVAIARAIATNAKLIILDEPTTALLPQEVEILFSHMRRLAKEGHSFIYVSHRLPEVLNIADQVTILRDGKFAGTFERKDMTPQKLVAAILGSEKAFIGDVASDVSARTHGAVMLDVDRLSGAQVQDVSFQLRAGEILGVAGLPGSGAEEILDLLFGRSRVRDGEIVLNSNRLKMRSPRDAVKAGFALVPKERLVEALFPSMSVRANISLSSLQHFLFERVVRLVQRGKERTAVKRLVKMLNVKTATIETRIDALSGGNQQKAVIARWVGTKAKVYLLNSPTAAVDVGAKAEIYLLLEELTKMGAAVLFTTTELEEFPRLCNRVIVFRSGRMARELSGDQVTEANIMHASIGENLETD